MEQQELFALDTWFHVFRDMIESGELKRMGPHAFTVYCVIKAHAGRTHGRAWPSVDRIVELSGISRGKVMQELNALEEMGYVKREKEGRRAVYMLREKVRIMDSNAQETAALAHFDYVPNLMRAVQKDLENVVLTGDLSSARVVHIERLHVQIGTLNIVAGDQHNHVTLYGATNFDHVLDEVRDILPAEVFDKLLAIRAGIAAQGEP